MSDDRVYFRIEEGGFAQKQLDVFFEEYIETKRAWREIMEDYKSKSYYASTRLLGLLFKKKPPKGWINTKNLPKDCYKPQRRKECMEAYKVFQKAPSLPGGWQLTEYLGLDLVITDKGECHNASFEVIGNKRFLNLHKDSKIPDGVTPLKMSEYWALKEAEDAA